MTIQLVGKKNYNFKNDDGRTISGATLYGVVLDDSDNGLEGSRTWSESWSSPLAQKLVINDCYMLCYEKMRDGKARLSQMIKTEV